MSKLLKGIMAMAVVATGTSLVGAKVANAATTITYTTSSTPAITTSVKGENIIDTEYISIQTDSNRASVALLDGVYSDSYTITIKKEVESFTLTYFACDSKGYKGDKITFNDVSDNLETAVDRTKTWDNVATNTTIHVVNGRNRVGIKKVELVVAGESNTDAPTYDPTNDRATAITQLETYKNTQLAVSSKTDNGTVQTAYDNGVTAINAATTKDTIDQALVDAKTAIDNAITALPETSVTKPEQPTEPEVLYPSNPKRISITMDQPMTQEGNNTYKINMLSINGGSVTNQAFGTRAKAQKLTIPNEKKWTKELLFGGNRTLTFEVDTTNVVAVEIWYYHNRTDVNTIQIGGVDRAIVTKELGCVKGNLTADNKTAYIPVTNFCLLQIDLIVESSIPAIESDPNVFADDVNNSANMNDVFTNLGFVQSDEKTKTDTKLDGTTSTTYYSIDSAKTSGIFTFVGATNIDADAVNNIQAKEREMWLVKAVGTTTNYAGQQYELRTNGKYINESTNGAGDDARYIKAEVPCKGYIKFIARHTGDANVIRHVNIDLAGQIVDVKSITNEYATYTVRVEKGTYKIYSTEGGISFPSFEFIPDTFVYQTDSETNPTAVRYIMKLSNITTAAGVSNIRELDLILELSDGRTTTINLENIYSSISDVPGTETKDGVYYAVYVFTGLDETEFDGLTLKAKMHVRYSDGLIIDTDYTSEIQL